MIPLMGSGFPGSRAPRLRLVPERFRIQGRRQVKGANEPAASSR